MTDLIRLVYASRSTTTPSVQQQGVDREVARILAKSRRNNARLRVVGGLLFGHGNFLQCLEGEAGVVDALYRRIEADPRHRDVTLMSRRRVDKLSFGTWSMKFAPAESALAELLRAWDMPRFDPYQLSPLRVEAAVRYMVDGDDTVVETRPEGLEEPAAPASTLDRGRDVAAPVSVADRAHPRDPAAPSRAAATILWVVGLALVAGSGAVWWLMR